MAFSEFELKKCEKALNDFIALIRPPADTRAKLDFGYKIEGQSVFVTEIRPNLRNPEVTNEHAFAKATFVKTQKVWKIYWQRADLKWHSYEPVATVKHIEDFLNVINKDEYGCFFG